MEYIFKLIFHLGKLAQYLKFSTFCPLKQTWSKLGLWLYLLYLSKPAQYWEFDHICYPQANLFRTLTPLIFAIRAGMVNNKSLITFAAASKLLQDLNLDHICRCKQNFPILRVWSHLPPPRRLFKIKGLVTFATWANVLEYLKFVHIWHTKQCGSIITFAQSFLRVQTWSINHILNNLSYPSKHC